MVLRYPECELEAATAKSVDRARAARVLLVLVLLMLVLLVLVLLEKLEKLELVLVLVLLVLVPGGTWRRPEPRALRLHEGGLPRQQRAARPLPG